MTIAIRDLISEIDQRFDQKENLLEQAVRTSFAPEQRAEFQLSLPELEQLLDSYSLTPSVRRVVTVYALNLNYVAARRIEQIVNNHDDIYGALSGGGVGSAAGAFIGYLLDGPMGAAEGAFAGMMAGVGFFTHLSSYFLRKRNRRRIEREFKESREKLREHTLERLAIVPKVIYFGDYHIN